MVKNEVEPQDKVVTITDSAMFLSYTSNIRIIRPQGCKSEYYARITLIVDHETASDASQSQTRNNLDNTAIVNLREAYHKYYEEHEDTVMIEKVFNDIGYINIDMSKQDLAKLSKQCKIDGHVQFDMNIAVMEAPFESEVKSLSDLKTPTNINKIPDSFEVTLGIIRPNYLDHETDILDLLSKSRSLEVITKRYVQFTEDDVEFLYQQYTETECFDDLKKELISDVSLALILFGKNAVAEWNSICKSINIQRDINSGCVKLRSSFGEDISQNAVYGSNNVGRAEKDIRYFFPDFKFQSVSDVGMNSARDKELAQKYLETNLHPVLSRGLAELATIRPENPAEWLGNWLIKNSQKESTMQQ